MERFVKLLFLASFCSVCGSQKIENGYQSWVTDPKFSVFPTLPIVAPYSEDAVCRADSQLFLEALKNKTYWAVQMWDSSAKVPDGVLGGEIFHYGNFDECLKIKAPIKVHYCLGHLVVKISPNFYNSQALLESSPTSSVWTHLAESRINPSKVPRDFLGWGLCLPASCKTSDIQNTINAHLLSYSQQFYNETNFFVHVDDNFCTKESDHLDFTPAEIAFWIVLFSLILLSTSSSFMDLIPSQGDTKHSKIYKLWMLFSVKQNFTRLVPLEKRRVSPLDAFHGIKFISMLFIVYGHRIGIGLSVSAVNYYEIEDHFLEDHKMGFLHSDLVVDTFFFISGLLACYVLMDIFSKRFVNPLNVIAVRLFRLAPFYFMILWYQSTAAFRFGSGPLWNPLAKNETEYCVQNWWLNVLFVNNYFKSDEMCMPHSWFLACELHFFTGAVLLVILLTKYPKIGRYVLGATTIIFILVPAVVIYMKKADPFILFYYRFLAQPRRHEIFNILYIKSHNRAAVYLIGMCTGLYLHYKKDSKDKISMKLTLAGVAGWFLFMFAPAAYGSVYYDLNKTYNAIEAAIFGSLRRVSWAVAFTLFILAHRFGTIPLCNFFLSSRLSVFLSRITYGIYLIHFSVVTSNILTNRTPVFFTVHDGIIIGMGDIAKSAAATIVLFFILEIPLKRFFNEFLFAKKVKEFQQPPEVPNVFTVRL